MVTHQYSKSRQGEACWYFERRAQGQGSPHFEVSMNCSVQNISKSLWRIVGLTFHFLAGGNGDLYGFIQKIGRGEAKSTMIDLFQSQQICN
jgi:hypothetical protein